LNINLIGLKIQKNSKNLNSVPHPPINTVCGSIFLKKI
jgi:hypothetical protein